MKNFKTITLSVLAVTICISFALMSVGCAATTLWLLSDDPEDIESVETTIVVD